MIKMLTESYKKRLLVLSGLITEMESQLKFGLFDKDKGKFPFNQEAMIQAIMSGAEVGLSFQSSNDKYDMPVSKYRIIHPVAIGINSKGNVVVRGVHVTGQSEKEALRTGVRSAEAEDEWRLFKVKNIKNMWLTGRYFTDVLSGYNNRDSGMSSQMAAFDKNTAIKNQEELRKNGVEAILT